MTTTFSLLFYLKKNKSYQNGQLPIYLRFTVDGERTETATGRTCYPEDWSSAANRCKATKPYAKEINAYLDVLRHKAFVAQNELAREEIPITAESLRDKFLGKEETKHELIAIFKEHNEKMEALVGHEYTKGTFGRYKTSLKHTIDFIKWKYKVDKLDIRKVNHAFIMEYEFYLKSVRRCANNSTVKYLKNFGKIIRICLANGWIIRDPFINYKSKLKAVERVFLTSDELQTIANRKFETERLSIVRDIFLFSCFTGLAYVDVKKLKRSELVTGVDGDLWISTKRQKTDIASRIPLLPSALKIIGKYADNPECEYSGLVFPVLSNQKMNAYLKEIVDLCGIKKNITFHIARHTFATTVTLLNGVSIESVSKMLGHTTIKTTQHYAKILDIKVSQDMASLKAKFIE